MREEIQSKQLTIPHLSHSVVTTVRSQEKADKIKQGHPNVGKDKLDFAIVEDIAIEGAFEEAVKSDPPFEAVIHTASPFHFNVTDIQKELLDPAVIGTTSILKSINAHAPSVKHVVVTSSFAAIVNQNNPANPGHTYSEEDWNPVSKEQAVENPMNGYRASKTFAEKAAWDFVNKEKPNFQLSTMNPPMVFGPIHPNLNSLSSLNTSNERIRDFIAGKSKDAIPATPVPIWIDVRDLALAHVKAIEVPEADGKRFFATAGLFTNREIVDIIRKNFPEYKDQLPAESVKGGEGPEGGFAKIDNARMQKLLGIKFRSIEESMVDLVKSLKKIGA
ncbi:NAD(P)-binding protein [Tothia fuscella]|uniref:NAD(P)-binding protein n=1 Tax=Tothia fuscella TaxID=1048955 RepID=A0A9P4NPD6_9PEZI|nr:NAD(P)-binding protein [Tothia fuscella]